MKRITYMLSLAFVATALCLATADAVADEINGVDQTDNGTQDDGPKSSPDDEVLEPDQTQITATPSDVFPGFTLYNGSVVCFRANLEAQLLITYYTKDLGKTKISSKTVDLPRSARVEGNCGSQTTTFSLVWANGSYTLTLIFQQKSTTREGKPAVTLSTWLSNSIAFKFDATNNPDLQNIKTPSIYTAKSDGEVHFEAPTNFSYACNTEEDITLYVMTNVTERDQTVIESVDLSLWNVKIQAFELPQNGLFSESASCKPDIDKNLPERNIVPLVMAAVLASIIVIIVIGYFFIKNRADTQYSSME